MGPVDWVRFVVFITYFTLTFNLTSKTSIILGFANVDWVSVKKCGEQQQNDRQMQTGSQNRTKLANYPKNQPGLILDKKNPFFCHIIDMAKDMIST